LLDTHTLSEVAPPGPVALSQAGLVARGRRSSWHAPLALMVIAAVLLVGAIALALSFILGT
jgi:hypothetical protein